MILLEAWVCRYLFGTLLSFLWDVYPEVELPDHMIILGLHWWLSGKETTYQYRRHQFHPWVRKIPWRRKWQPTPVFLPSGGAWWAAVLEVAKKANIT